MVQIQISFLKDKSNEPNDLTVNQWFITDISKLSEDKVNNFLILKIQNEVN